MARIEERLSAAWMRLLEGTKVESLRWLKCMQSYDREHTFFYCDLLYRQTESYGVEFGY